MSPSTIVTGAASGIGRHLVTVLSGMGHRVLATDVNESALEASRKELGWSANDVATRKLDVTSELDWESALDFLEHRFGPVDVALNVAGVIKPGNVLALSAADVDMHVSVNLKGTVLGTSAAARRMVAKGRGHIVNIGSLASLAPVPGLSLYCASKFAVRGFSLAAATELAERGVSVSLVMPDAVATPMLDLQVDYEEAAVTFSGSKPLTVEDVARVIVLEVLPKRPLEVMVPLGRGLLARAANTAPNLSRVLYPLLKKKGLAAQARAKRA